MLWGEKLTSEKSRDLLRGTTLAVYRLMLNARKPVGVREVQRELNLSSSSVARYHVLKLEDAGLIVRKEGKYVVSKFILEDVFKIRRFFVPRFLFYASSASVFLLVALILRVVDNCAAYYFAIAAIGTLTMLFWFETSGGRLKGRAMASKFVKVAGVDCASV
jgi:hypothetical protein